MNKIHIYFLLAAIFFPVVSNSEVIKLNNGDILNVIVKKQTKDKLIVEHTSLGELTIEKSKITNLQAFSLQTIQKMDDKQIAENKPVDEGLLGTGLLKGWNRSIDVGLTGAAGKSNDISFRSSIGGQYEDDKDRWDFKSIYIYKEDEHETTDNQLNVDLLKDWFVNDSPWLYFVHAGFDWDKFKDWDYRGRLSVGPGYQFVKNKQWELATRIGINGIYEAIEPKNILNLEGLIGLHLSWNITDKQSLKLDNFLYPSITDAGEYRNVTAFEWAHKLDYYKGLAIKFGFNNEYDSTETDKNDLKYYAAIAWGL